MQVKEGTPRVVQYDPRESAEYLQKTGLLMEINRQVLHPLGLALSCTAEASGGVISALELIEIDDPEGFVFDDEALEEAAGRLHEHMRGQIHRMARRAEALGFAVQPLPAKFRDG